jgi:hypothetical protein
VASLGGIIHDGGSRGVSKSFEGKAMDFESWEGGLEEALGQSPWSSKHRGRHQRASMLGEGQGVKASGLPNLVWSTLGGKALGCL